VTVALRGLEHNSLLKYLLPVLIVVGALATMAGSSSLLTGSSGPGAAVLAGLRRIRGIRIRLRRKQ
jgi:hypothetical protein